jgi:hypothetical protein
MKAFIAAVAVVGGIVGVLIAVCVCSGWVLQLMWRWFMPVLFPGIPLLSLPVAIGISLIAALLTHQDMSHLAKKPGPKTWQPLVDLFTRPLFVLLIGWVVRQFI